MSDKAILFFSRSAEEEANYKVFHRQANARENIAISQCLIDSTKEIIRSSGYKIFNYDCSNQHGGNFGVRLANAISEVFFLGYEEIVILGNDCPSLTQTDIHNAFDSLDRGHMVVGPASDGGAYLIGINRNHFDHNTFIYLDWNQSSLQDSFIEYFDHHSIDALWLHELEDVDSSLDFKKLLSSLSPLTYLKTALQRIIANIGVVQQFVIKQLHVLTIQRPGFSLRGPPAF